MKSPFSKRISRIPAVLLAAVALVATPALAIDFKSVDAPVSILYDAPSAKGKKLFLLKKYTPLEVIVTVEGFTKVREPEGAIGWVEKKTLSDKRQLLVTAAKAQIRSSSAPDAPLVFEAEKGVALEFLEPAKEGLAKVKHLDGSVGVVRISQVWGL